jgi:hypothetical protein
LKLQVDFASQTGRTKFKDTQEAPSGTKMGSNLREATTSMGDAEEDTEEDVDEKMDSDVIGAPHPRVVNNTDVMIGRQ